MRLFLAGLVCLLLAYQATASNGFPSVAKALGKMGAEIVTQNPTYPNRPNPDLLENVNGNTPPGSNGVGAIADDVANILKGNRWVPKNGRSGEVNQQGYQGPAPPKLLGPVDNGMKTYRNHRTANTFYEEIKKPPMPQPSTRGQPGGPNVMQMVAALGNEAVGAVAGMAGAQQVADDRARSQSFRW